MGVPQLAAILNVVEQCDMSGVPVIVDGGVHSAASFSKAIAAGAESVIIDLLFAGTDEAPGEIVYQDGQAYKIVNPAAKTQHRPLTSSTVRDPYRLDEDPIDTTVPYRGSVVHMVKQLVTGLRTGMAYTRREDDQEMRDKAEFVRGEITDELDGDTMTPSARIQAVIEVLGEIIATPRPADTLTSAYFRGRRFIGSKDRTAINGAVVPRHARISPPELVDFARALRSGRPRPRHLRADDRQRADAHGGTPSTSTFPGGKYAPAPLTKPERKLAEITNGNELVHEDMPLREKSECPEWAFALLQQALDGEFEKEMDAMMHPAPLDLRVNALKANRDDVLAELKHDGFDAHAGELSPLSIRVFGRPHIAQHHLFKDEFMFEIQDEGSQLVALVADAEGRASRWSISARGPAARRSRSALR